VPSAIEIYDWTAGGAFTWAVNLCALDRNKRQARKVADKIIDYQNRYPNRPVHIVGHSGGGGLAVLVLEALPPTRQISAAVLLAPALSPTYDLSRALRRTSSGIWNFYSPYDVGFLRAGTTVFGSIDGEHGSSAGAVAFTPPWGLASEDRLLYRSKLHQQRYTYAMSSSGHSGGHFGWADERFVKNWLAPLVYSQIEAQTHYASDPTQ
jgi:pimeloyl-ACP methyl ester carboxylesterase